MTSSLMVWSVSAWEAEKAKILQDMNKSRHSNPQSDVYHSITTMTASYDAKGEQDQVMESLRNELLEKKDKEVN